MSSFFKRKKVPNEWNFAATGKVSIWIGDFDDETDLLEYVEDPDGLGRDFGCVLIHSRELAVESEPKPLRELLRGFSWYDKFVNEIPSLGGVEMRARCAVVAYACDYTLLGSTPKTNTRLRFLGVVSC